ncbi:MAG: hypothetical protein U0797_00975 [Gemmataceae bacterium]
MNSTEIVSVLNLTPEAERRMMADFCLGQTAPDYKARFSYLIPWWHEINGEHFDGKLTVPHFCIGRTSPRRFSECELTTSYGGQVAITLADRIVFGLDRRVVRTDDLSAQGLLLFQRDLLYGETVKQFVLEVDGVLEEGWGGRGPRFVEHANRIGKTMGLRPVQARRRAHRGAGMPVAASWPWAFRPDGYYLGHVRLSHLRVGGLRQGPPSGPLVVVPGIYEYLLYLLVTGRSDRLQWILEREVDADRAARSPALARFERSPHDESGAPLPVPAVRPEWLAWNFGCVRNIAAGILARRAWDGSPVLADALTDAGCEDEVLLDHLRVPREHLSTCWALRLLAGSPTGAAD